MKYCRQCGAKMEDGDKFCASCGTPAVPQHKKDSHIDENGGKQEFLQEEKELPEPARYTEEVCLTRTIKNIDLIGYLQRVTSLETSVYTQIQTMNKLGKHIDSLGHPTEYPAPNQPVEYSGNLLKGTWGALTSGTVIVGFLIWIFSRLSFLSSMFLGAFLSVGIVIAFNAWECDSENKRRQERYANEYARYTEAVERDKVRVKGELEEKAALNPIIQRMQTQLDETRNVLEQYYSLDIIFPKYRNLIAICSFYEYFLSGRCEALAGHEGAYNIFENEARLDRICTKLDEVVQRLDEIKTNQYMLYDVIQKGNHITELLVEESVKQSRLAERTAQNTALSAHYAKIAADNAEACAWISAANYLANQEDRR